MVEVLEGKNGFDNLKIVKSESGDTIRFYNETDNEFLMAINKEELTNFIRILNNMNKE